MPDTYFFDSSAITKRYYREQGTSWVQAICTKRVRPIIYLSDIARSRLGNNGPYIFVPVIDDVMVTAGYLADRFVNPPNILRSMDAIQLATALLISRTITDPLTFIVADAKLEAMAQAIGLATDNPMRHP